MLYVSSSFTHGGFSNDPPEPFIYDIYKQLVTTNSLQSQNDNYSPYIYISRRTHISNDTSNIGTNYTTRRKMMNEDELVDKLKKLGIKEVFAESLSMDEKINMFHNAKLVIGSIGGGMANLLFSPPTVKSIVIVTPYFLDINYRFRYSMENTDITYINDVRLFKDGNIIPMYCRCKILHNGQHKNKIGEIINWRKPETNSTIEEYLINLSNNDVAGFNNDASFQQEWFLSNEIELLDNGLNSPYEVDINRVIELTNTIMQEIL
jgi:hypothetical protein